MWLDIIKLIIEVVTKKKETTSSDNKKISEFFSEISEILEATANDLKEDKYPHGACQTLAVLSNSILNILRDKMPIEDAISLAKLLDEACLIEREWAHRHDPKTIETLLKASGEFKAHSQLVLFN
jgi:hypothetical protein